MNRSLLYKNVVVLPQMETRVCLNRVITVACVKMGSVCTHVTVPPHLKDRVVRLVNWNASHHRHTLTLSKIFPDVLKYIKQCVVVAAIPMLCESENGGCDHFCSVKKENVVCSCAEGYRLTSNGKSCQSDGNTTTFTAVNDHSDEVLHLH